MSETADPLVLDFVEWVARELGVRAGLLKSVDEKRMGFFQILLAREIKNPPHKMKGSQRFPSSCHGGSKQSKSRLYGLLRCPDRG